MSQKEEGDFVSLPLLNGLGEIFMDAMVLLAIILVAVLVIIWNFYVS